MSKKITIFIFTLSLALLGACSSSSEEDISVRSNSGETKVVTDYFGETEIPSDPQKVVALTASLFDHMIAIDEKPIAVTTAAQYGGGYIPYLADELEGAEILEGSDTISLEQVLATEPDLIISDQWMVEGIYEDLKEIAPVVVIGTDDSSEYNDPDFWEADFIKTAEIFGKTEEAQEIIDQLDEQTAEVKKQVAQLENKKMAFLRIREKVINLYAETGHPMNTLLYSDLGFEPSAMTPPDSPEDLSLEVIPEIDAAHLFLQVDGIGGSSNYESMQESTIWNSVEAVDKNQVISTDYWIYKSWGSIGRAEMLNEIQSYLEDM
jgi:iron complex transport system substrate-binding protein